MEENSGATAVRLDMEKRRAPYAEFQQIVSADLPIYWINATPYHTAFSKKLKNAPKGIWGTMHPMDMVEWAE